MKTPRVLVLYNEPVLPTGHPFAASELEVLTTAERTRRLLAEAGFVAESYGISVHPAPLLAKLAESRPDVVFNLFEGLADRSETEVSVASLLEWLQLPITGSPASALSLGRDKARTKHLLTGAGLPTAPFVVAERVPVPEHGFGWPVIVKPAFQDASEGITQDSVVTDSAGLNRQVERVLSRYGPPVLVERYIAGRELHVTVVEDAAKGLTVLPPAELLFAYTDPTHWPIYSYDAKWTPESPDYLATPLDLAEGLSASLRERIDDVAKRAFRLVGCRDYARIDLRVEGEEPYILEVNPNPFLYSIAIVEGLGRVGVAHADFIAGLVWSASRRTGMKANGA